MARRVPSSENGAEQQPEQPEKLGYEGIRESGRQEMASRNIKFNITRIHGTALLEFHGLDSCFHSLTKMKIGSIKVHVMPGV